MKKLLFTILLLCVFCKWQELTIAEVLASKEGSVWAMVWPSDKRAYRAYKFYNNGHCLCYLINPKGKLIKYEFGDDEVTDTWRISESTLNINGENSCVIKYSKREVSLLYKKDTIKLKKMD